MTPGPDAAGAQCVPNQVISCPCRNGGQGIQACQPNGTFSQCDCPVSAEPGPEPATEAGVDVIFALDAIVSLDGGPIDASIDSATSQEAGLDATSIDSPADNRDSVTGADATADIQTDSAADSADTDVVRLPNGTQCQRNNQCISGACSAGNCCNTFCLDPLNCGGGTCSCGTTGLNCPMGCRVFFKDFDGDTFGDRNGTSATMPT